MTTRDQVHKWFFYALGLVPIWVLDAFVLNRIAPFGVIPMLLPLAVAAVAVLEGAYAGGFGGLVFGMALAGMAVGAASQYVLSQNFFSCLLCSAVVLGALDGLRLIRALFIRLDTLDVLLRVAVPEVLLSLCWTPLVYLIFRFIFRRVGGTRLA